MKTTNRFILIAAAVMLAIFTVGCSFSATTAKIEDAIMTDSIDAEGKPGEEVVSYPADAQTLYASAKIKNAPDNTKIRIVWTYVTENQLIDEVTMDSGDISDRYIYSDLTPTAILPLGDYKVEFFVEEREEPDAVVKFVVVDAENKTAAVTTDGAYLEDIHMTSSMGADGVPVDTIDTVAPTGTWYVSAVLRNTQPDTMVHFVWYDTDGNVIDSFDFNPEGKTDVYISGSLELTTIAPEGQYLVELYLDDAKTPAAQVTFTVSNVSSENAVSAADFSKYSQTEGGFSISYPKDWYLADMKENKAAGFYPLDYVIEGQDEVNGVIIVSLPGNAAGYTLDTALSAWISETEKENLGNYAQVDKGTDTANGNNMAYYEYSWSRDNYDLYTIDFLFINGDTLYVITFTATQDKLDILYPYVEQMVLSFQML